MFIEKLCQELNKNKVAYAIVGGYALAFHGAVRGTLDIDFIVKWNKKNLIKAIDVLTSLGLQSRLPLKVEEVFDFRDEYIKNKNLIAWNFYNPNNLLEQVDIIITQDLDDYKLKKIKSSGVEIHLLSLDSLIKMKEEAGRKQDIEDVKSLKRIKNEK